MATRPAPGKVVTKPPAAPKPPTPKPPTPNAPNAPKPPTAPAGKPPTGAAQTRNQPATKVKPPKPTTNPGPGRSWVFNAKTNSWEAKAKSITVGNQPVTGKYVPGKGTVPVGPAADTSGGSGDSGDGGVSAAVEPVSSKTPEQIAADVTKAAESSVAMYDPALEGRYTSETKGLGGLGFGYTKAGGGTATYADIFGSLAPGASVDRNAFEVRDALGRVINTDILGTDVYGGRAATDIAGTALGNEILSARRSAAGEAEARSASGTGSGGIRNAAGEVQRQQEGASITGLLGKLYGLESDITNARTQRYQDALETAAGGDIGRWAPEPTVGNRAITPTTSQVTTGAGGKTTLTGGPKGTFMAQANAARAAGTPAQKIKKLNALLGNPKYNMSDLQKKTIKQMITDIQKKKK